MMGRNERAGPGDAQGGEAVEQFRIAQAPHYVAQGDEESLFAAAFRAKIPLILKGPTGCGKTRFIEHMAYKLDLALITVACHEDLTAADLVGRYLLERDRTVWRDGALTLAVRHGGICYLDEIVEARKDTTVIIHSLTDHRRMLYIDKTGEVVRAHPDFMMVLSYNPGYQSVVKDLKQSTKQRFVSLSFSYPEVEIEAEIVHTETGLDLDTSVQLARLGAHVRELAGFGLEEGASTRLLIYAGWLIQQGLDPAAACTHAVAQTLTDDLAVLASIQEVIQLFFGDLVESAEVEIEQG
jgi:nitric oxide reductase NorQ protein